ncbi:MAG: CGNR zinc finger domain-containing protein [Nitriliruptorales bacterium]
MTQVGEPEILTVRTFQDPGNPAPDALEVVRQFINTSTHEKPYDAFATVEAAARWIDGTGLLEHPVELDDEAGVERLRTAREGLRALAVANRSGEGYGPLIALVNRVLAAAPVVVRLRKDGTSDLTPASESGVEAFLGRLFAIVHDNALAGRWERLKCCRQCSWGFYDRSKNRSGQWCSMRVCGSRQKMRRARARQAHG